MAKTLYKKKKPEYTGGLCPQCGSKLVVRRNYKTRETFTGCSGYPRCKYTYSPLKYLSREEYVIFDSFPDGWKPNFDDNHILKLLEKCDSRPEIRYILGAAYFLDKNHDSLNSKIFLTIADIFYNNKDYEAIWFNEPYLFWGGGIAPSAMAIVPQLEFAGKCHHDFGIFFADTHSPSKNDWYFEIAVEIDYHPKHFFSTSDWGRDSLVNYPVLRFQPEENGYLTWFSRVKNYWDNKQKYY